MEAQLENLTTVLAQPTTTARRRWWLRSASRQRQGGLAGCARGLWGFCDSCPTTTVWVVAFTYRTDTGKGSIERNGEQHNQETERITRLYTEPGVVYKGIITKYSKQYTRDKSIVIIIRMDQ